MLCALELRLRGEHVPNALTCSVSILLGLLVAVSSGASFSDEVLSDQPLAYYRFDESGGAVAADSSGNGITASYGGNTFPELGLPGLTGDGNPAIGLSGFPADRSHVLVPGVFNPAETSFTLEALVSVNELGGNQIIFQQRDLNGSGRTLLRISSTGEIDSFIGGVSRRSGKFVTAGEVLHLALVFERSQTSAAGEAKGALTFFVNGVVESQSSLADPSGVESSEGDFLVGIQKGINGQYFNGIIDEVAFYDEALSTARLLEHYESIDEVPQITFLKADPPGIEAGQSSKLSWDLSEAVIGIAMDQGVGNFELEERSVTVSPRETTTYTLFAANGKVLEERSITVEVGPIGPFRISEILANNTGPLQDEDGDESDWIEVSNQGGIIGSLAGWYLTDDPENLTKWEIPQGTVQGEGYLLIFASGKNRVGAGGELHTNFRLSQEGEYLALIEPDGVTVHDGFVSGFPSQQPGVSWGVSADETGYFVNPTPGAVNGVVAAGFVEEEVAADVGRGFFEEPFEVVLSTEAVEAEIYFTIDGTEPTKTSGQLYVDPIPVSKTTILRAGAFRGDEVPLKIMTRSYLFLDDVLDQPAAPAGFPSVWQPSVSADYAMDDSAKIGTRAEIKTALRDLPTLSLVMEVGDWFNNNTDPAIGGIYANSTIARGSIWERKVSAEFFDFPHGKEIQVDAGMRIFGNASRSTSRKKHNMRLVFRSSYGPSKLVFPLFGDDGDDDEVNSCLLRGQNGDSWFHPSATQRAEALYIRDQLSRELQSRMHQPASKQDHIHVYLNGLYWGVFNTIERIEGDSMANAYGGDKDDWDVVKASPPSSVEAEDGTPDAWQQVVALAADGLVDEVNFAAIQELLDLENYIDWLILNFYTGNSDWDHNNWQAARRRDEDDRFRFFVWDSERSILSAGTDSTTKNNVNRPTGFHQRLRQNPEYRMMFADRVHRHFFNSGVLRPGAVENVFNEFVQELRVPLVAESARWGDAQRAGNPYAVGVEWLNQVNVRRNSYFPGRTATVLNQLRNQNLYPGVEAPVFSKFGGDVSAGFPLLISVGAGEVRYTLNDSDPRAPDAGIYTGPLNLTESVIVKARTLNNGVWSALTTAVFYVGTVPASAENLAISEIHYHPASGDGGEEFVELWNFSNGPVDLRGVWFDDGLGFSFGNGPNPILWVLGPGERLVLVGNKDDFEESGMIAGEFTGDLDNGGERIALFARDGALIDEVTFDDEFPWPAAADGAGYSLVKSIGGEWRRSGKVGGSPGSHDAVEFDGVAGNDTDGDGLDDLLEFYLGANPRESSSGPEAIRLEVHDANLVLRVTRRVGADSLQMLVEQSSDLESWKVSDSIFVVEEGTLDERRDEILLQLDKSPGVKFFRLKIEMRP